MERKYKYAGYSNGCIIASNKLGANADIIERMLKDLHDNNIKSGVVINKPMSRIFEDMDITAYSKYFGGVLGDEFIINHFAFYNPFWYGHYAKVDGEWLCSIKMYKAIGNMFFGKEPTFGRKIKDYTDIINHLGAASAGGWLSYTKVVDRIAEVNSCSIHRAKSLMTMFIREGYLVKNKIHSSYQVGSYITKHNNDELPSAVELVKPTKTYKYRPTDRDILDSIVASKGKYNELYLNYVEQFDVKDGLMDEADTFIKEYVADDRIEDKQFYTLDDWINKRIAAQGWTSDEVVHLIYAFVDTGYANVDYDKWMISFNKDCKRDVN